MKGFASLLTLGAVIIVIMVMGTGLIGIANIQQYLGSLAASFTAGGLTIQSISQVDIIVNNQPNPNGYFRIAAVANRGAETITGTVQPYDFKSETGIDVQNAFTISLTGLKETARYNTYPEGDTRVYVIEENPSGAPCTWLCGGKCLLKKDKAIVGGIRLDQVKSDVDVRLSTPGKSEAIHVSSTQTSSPISTFGSGNTVQWLGGLSTGDQLPLKDWNFKSLWLYTSTRWRLVSTGRWDYTFWKDEWTRTESYLNSKVGQWCVYEGEYKQKIDNYNAAANRLLAVDESAGYGCSSGTGTSSAGTLDCLVSVATMNPQLLFTIKAGWIGIKVSSAKPIITSAYQSGAFYSGEVGTITMTVRNAGDYPGAADISLENCMKIRQKYSMTGIQFAASETKTLTMHIESTGYASGTEACTLKACDKAGISGCTTYNINLNMQEPRRCIEGNERDDGQCKYKCINNAWVQQGECTPPPSGGGLGLGLGGGNLLDIIVNFLKVWLISTVIIGIVMLVASVFVKPLKVLLFGNLFTFILIAAGLGLILAVLFTPIPASVAVQAGLL